jgi:CRP-like cAMP-binding protein
MALLDDSNPLRSANAVSQTMVSLAVLTKEDFRSICELFPAFHHKIILMVKLRKYMNERFQLELQKRLSIH